MNRIVYVLAFICAVFSANQSFSCVVIFAGKDATTDGSVIVSHSDDAYEDNRLLNIIPLMPTVY